VRVDAHQHFWARARGDYGWLETIDAVKPIRQDYYPADFEAYRARHGIERTVLVQAAPSIEETEYMLGLADATPWIAKVVGWVDFENPDHRRHLERWARHAKFSGVRPMIQDIADTDWMLRPDVQWAYDAVCALDLTFDALGVPRHLGNFQRLFDRYPKMRIVIDHCLKPEIRNNRFDDWAAAMAKIAAKTPVHCKLSGLATEAKARLGCGDVETLCRPRHQQLRRNPRHVGLRLAGGQSRRRLRCIGAAAAEEIVISPVDAERIFGGTAQEFYRIS
jgi:L-fuconolactonase